MEVLLLTTVYPVLFIDSYYFAMNPVTQSLSSPILQIPPHTTWYSLKKGVKQAVKRDMANVEEKAECMDTHNMSEAQNEWISEHLARDNGSQIDRDSSAGASSTSSSSSDLQ
jgi:hypothetical protein